MSHESPSPSPREEFSSPPRMIEGLTTLTRARVVMVDDDPVMVAVVQTFLEEAGYRDFIGLCEPREAVARIQSERPDVLLLDLKMPEINGFDILRAVRSDPRTVYLPVIVMTSASDARTKLRVLELGATDFLEKPVDSSELTLRLRNTLAFKAYRDRLEFFDPLTSLPNRRMFLSELVSELRRSARNATELAVMQLNIDDFKRINETLGHHAGDDLLQAFAERLQDIVRDSDLVARTGEGPSGVPIGVSRVGVDEFSLMLIDLKHAEDAALVASRIHARLAEPFLIANNELFLSAAIGVAGTPDDGRDAKTLFHHANIAVSQAKQRGRNAFAFYARQSDESARERLAVESQMRRALERDEFRLHYQPKVDLATGRISGAEALIRWEHPTRGLLGPNIFIPTAEGSDLIVEIGQWVIKETCRQVRIWQDRGHDLVISLNISSAQLRDGLVLHHLREAVRESGVSPAMLTIELTESSVMKDAVVGREVMADLRHTGVRTSLDDFGTGYSSLSHLNRMPLDELKIDKSFIDEVPHDHQGKAIVSAIIAMAHTLGLKVVAEGVEHEAQREFLAQVGCDIFQGYLFSRPVPPERLEALLESDGTAPVTAVQALPVA